MTAAKELREEGQATKAGQDTILAVPIDLLMDVVGVHIIRGKPPTSTCGQERIVRTAVTHLATWSSATSL